MKLKILCKNANHICDKSQYKEASFWEKLKLNLHLLYCKACRKYTAKNQKLTHLLKDSKIKTISRIDKDRLKEQLRKELDK